MHLERYALVERIAKDLATPLPKLVGDATIAARIDVRRYVEGDVGEPTLRDIVAELARPGRDPRANFVRDPHEVVRPGQPLKVRVLSVDHARKRIALSAKT